MPAMSWEVWEPFRAEALKAWKCAAGVEFARCPKRERQHLRGSPDDDSHNNFNVSGSGISSRLRLAPPPRLRPADASHGCHSSPPRPERLQLDPRIIDQHMIVFTWFRILTEAGYSSTFFGSNSLDGESQSQKSHPWVYFWPCERHV